MSIALITKYDEFVRKEYEIVSMIHRLIDNIIADCNIISNVKNLDEWKDSVADLEWMIIVVNCLLLCLLSNPSKCKCDETVWDWLHGNPCELDDFFEM